jgi:peptidoglycan/xylan/chitin deacetylase (PgdA/CDA1 family)
VSGSPRQIEVHESAAGSPELLGCFLDAPVAGSRLPGALLDIEGWALDQRGDCVAVEVGGSGIAVRRAPEPVRRRDVAAAHPGAKGASRSGFRALVEVTAPGEFEVRLDAVTAERRVALGRVRGRLLAGERVAPWGLILLYHRVADGGPDPWGLAVAPSRFAAHMEALRRRARPARLLEQAEALCDGGPPMGSVAVTFDDGYAETLDRALPVLERHGIPATVFVTTGDAGDPRPFWWDELARRLLDDDGWRAWEEDATAAQSRFRALWERLRDLEPEERRRELDALGGREPDGSTDRCVSAGEIRLLARHPLVDLGAHTVTHPRLSRLPEAEQSHEIRSCKSQLEEIAGRPVRAFAYPFGGRDDYTEATRRLVGEAGFRVACSNVAGIVDRGSDLFQLPRMLVGDWDGAEFAARLSRWLGE